MVLLTDPTSATLYVDLIFVMFQSRNTPRTVQLAKCHFIQVISYVEEKLPCQILPSILIFSQDILRNKIRWVVSKHNAAIVWEFHHQAFFVPYWWWEYFAWIVLKMTKALRTSILYDASRSLGTPNPAPVLNKSFATFQLHMLQFWPLFLPYTTNNPQHISNYFIKYVN